MEHSKLTQFRGPEASLPAPLFSFLQQLGSLESSEAVWTAFKTLSTALGFPSAYYIQASNQFDDAQDGQPAWHVQSSHTPMAAELLPEIPVIRALLCDSDHARTLEPKLLMSRHEGQMPGALSLDHPLFKTINLTVGLAIPVMSGDADDRAVILLGSAGGQADFNALLERFGCGLHLAALASHTRYRALYKQEFILRAQLTEKQTELVTLVGQGLLDKQIAHQLGISFSAVRQRLAAVQTKTGARNRAHLSAMAMRIGLTQDPLITPMKMAAE